MSCTTILVGKKASFDGSTIIARNEDCSSGEFCEKRMSVENAAGKKTYKSVIGHLEVALPEGGGRYTCMPNADLKDGLWEAAGVNEHNVAMYEHFGFKLYGVMEKHFDLKQYCLIREVQ